VARNATGPSAADAVRPTRARRSLGWFLRAVDAGTGPFARAAAISLGATAILSIAITLAVRPPGSLPRSQTVVIGIALAALCLVGMLGVVSMWWPADSRARLLDRVAAPATRAAIWLSLAVWFPLLLISAYLKARATEPPTVEWLAFGFLDKRWETSVYLLGTLAPMLLVVAAVRVLDAGREHPESWRAWLKSAVATGRAAEVAAPDLRRITVARVAVGVVTAVALAYYFYGPPWYLDRNAGGIDYHEDVHFGGLQAISQGHVPYTGPAAIQYGPGAQLLSYLYMRHVGTFSVLGARESWALFHWVGATIFFVVLFLTLGYVRGLIGALVAALVYPTLQLFGFEPGQTWGGFFGWADILRYTGAFTLLMLLPPVIRRCPSRRGLAAGAALGFFWGALSYVAQENLLAGALGALAIGALLLLSRSASAAAVRTALLGVLGGAVLVWLPILGYYGVEGELGRSVWLYFFVPRAVAEGYSNSSYLEGLHSPWGRMFYAFPFVLAVLALVSMLRFRPLGIAVEWSRDRILLVGTLVTTIVLYEGALLRSDQTHLIGTMLPVPVLVIVVTTTLPKVVGARRLVTRLVAGAALVCGALVLVPSTAFTWSGVKARVEAPYLDRRHLAAQPSPPTPSTVAGKRVGAGLARAPTCCTHSTWSMPRFIRLMNRIHRIVGDRVAYVVDFPDGYPGLVYLVADLRPAPIPLEPYTMVLTSPQRDAFYADFQMRVLPRTQALVTSDLSATETQYFLAAYKSARRVTLEYRGKPYYVLLR
jgi:hypothetical protein